MAKTETWWVIKDERQFGRQKRVPHLMAITCSRSRKGAWWRLMYEFNKSSIDDSNSIAHYRKEGYRAVKIEVREVEG